MQMTVLYILLFPKHVREAKATSRSSRQRIAMKADTFISNHTRAAK